VLLLLGFQRHRHEAAFAFEIGEVEKAGALAETLVRLLDGDDVRVDLPDDRYDPARIEAPVEAYGLVNVVGGDDRVDVVAVMPMRPVAPVLPTQCRDCIGAYGFDELYGLTLGPQHRVLDLLVTSLCLAANRTSGITRNGERLGMNIVLNK